ncbi:hypothetical protein AAEX63_07895 [Luteococcus sp. H138]|uniref:hypothetical protein n=1 Tax=unclassified Luteococcus TaxID=2639923 RepID=UPI00313E840D
MGAIRELDNETGLVAFCFGLAGAPGMSGSGLVALLGVFGKSPAASRSLIARLQRRGVLVGHRFGRNTHYVLAGATAHQFGLLRDRGVGLASEHDDWDGCFRALFFHAPEKRRVWRDQTRRVGVAHGFRLLRPGLLVHPRQGVDELAAHLAPAPAGATLLAAQLQFASADARQLVRDLWELDDLAVRVSAARAELVKLGAAPREPGRDDLLRYAGAMRPAYFCLLLTPALPSELLPTDWPMADLLSALAGVHQTWTPAMVAVAQGVVSAASSPSAS